MHSVDWRLDLWPKILSLIQSSIDAVAPAVTAAMEHKSIIDKKLSCFEFFGYDILIDENFKPWLLEVNSKPGLYSVKNNKRARRLQLQTQVVHGSHGSAQARDGYGDKDDVHGQLKSRMLAELFPLVPGATPGQAGLSRSRGSVSPRSSSGGWRRL